MNIDLELLTYGLYGLIIGMGFYIWRKLNLISKESINEIDSMTLFPGATLIYRPGCGLFMAAIGVFLIIASFF